MDVKEQLMVSLFKARKIGMAFPTGMNAQLKEWDVNMAELALMKAIEGNDIDSEDNAGIADIQNFLFTTKSAISQMFGTLEKKDYLNRVVDKGNRRKLIVTLTPKGQEVLNIMEDKMNLLLTKIVSHVGEENTLQLIRSINLFADAMEEIKDEAFS